MGRLGEVPRLGGVRTSPKVGTWTQCPGSPKWDLGGVGRLGGVRKLGGTWGGWVECPRLGEVRRLGGVGWLVKW